MVVAMLGLLAMQRSKHAPARRSEPESITVEYGDPVSVKPSYAPIKAQFDSLKYQLPVNVLQQAAPPVNRLGNVKLKRVDFYRNGDVSLVEINQLLGAKRMRPANLYEAAA